MNEYKEVVKTLGNKLKKDREDTTFSAGEADLFYVMNIRLTDAIIKSAKSAGLSNDELVSMADRAADTFLNGMIELSEKYNE